MDIVPTIMVLYLWFTCRGQSQSPIFTVSIFSMELRPCLLSIFFGKYTVCSLSFTLKVTFPLLQSITTPVVLRKGLPRIMDMLPSSDEDIPTTTTTSPTLHDEQANQIRLGPVTRARAKLLEQQVNLLLLESDDRLNENYILPKSLCVCMIRYQGEDKELGGAEVREEEAKE